MSRKVKFLIAVSLAALLLIVGIGIPVMADTPTPTPTPPIAITKQAGVLDRVAQILNISRDTLVNAMKQAAQELKDQKPTSDDFYNKVAGILKISKDTLVSAIQQAAQETRDANINARLDKAVQNGVITSDEENQIKDWYSNKPSAVDKLFNSRLFGGPKGWGWGRCWGGFGGMRGFGGFSPGFRNSPKQPGLSPTATPNTTSFFPGSATSSPTY